MGLAVAVGGSGVRVFVGAGVAVSVGVAGTDVKVGGTCVVGKTGVDVGLVAPPGWPQAERMIPKDSSEKKIVLFIFGEQFSSIHNGVLVKKAEKPSV